MYVDKNKPELKQLAENLKDSSHRYCQSILDKTADLSGILWNEQDISKEIDETFCEYEVIRLVNSLICKDDWQKYESVKDILFRRITEDNKLPKTLITSEYPALSEFLSKIQENASASNYKDSLEKNLDTIQELFFDPTQKKLVQLTKSRLPNLKISELDLKDILKTMSNAFNFNEMTFLEELRTKIDQQAQQSVANNLKKEWKRFAQCETPTAWAIENKIPARLLFGEIAEAQDILDAIDSPSTFSSNRLEELLDLFKAIEPASISDCQKSFLKQIIPSKYEHFDINLSSLLEYICSKYDKFPNNWPEHPDVSEFIRQQYKGTFAPQIIEKIKKMTPEQLKKKLLELAQENQDLGLLFWE